MKYLVPPAGALLALAVTGTATAAAPAADAAGATAPMLPEVVVTAPQMSAPLTVETDPQAPRQPVPAHDGADYLKNVPGFSVIRKGGTDGDPVFRGMAGSRVNILIDGEQILGGCSARMDPPTAYVFPEAYDRVLVLKGPQSVLYGPGGSAATVLFERNHARRTEAGVDGHVSLLGGSFDRDDEVVAFNAGDRDGYVRFNGTRAQANDYEDGDGTAVHSQYERWSTNASLGWTPDDDTWVEFSGAQSDGEAAYADRTMDGSRFARDNVALKAEKRRISALLARVEAQVFRNYVDHVMDNYTLRSSMMPMAMNPDRLTEGARVAATLSPADPLTLVLGADAQRNQHSGRMSLSAPRVDDAEFSNAGLFGEATYTLGDQDRIIGGLRVDEWEAKDERPAGGMMAAATAGMSRDDTLTSAFLRHEHDLDAKSTAYAGIGQAQRFPDYWELLYKQDLATNSAFLSVNPETTTQLDIGWVYNAQRTSLSVSAFYNEISDFILIDTVSKPGATVSRNVDASTYGLEAGAAWMVADHWRVDTSVATVNGENETDDTPLAQTPPVEARAGLTFEQDTWSVGGLLRMVGRQSDVDPGMGNIAGQDIGPTPGFAIFSLNGAWRPAANSHVKVAAGVDNLFDVAYAEHISRAGAMVSGFTQTTRVNEPGTNLWIKLSADF